MVSLACGKAVRTGLSLAETDVFGLVRQFKFNKLVGAVFLTTRGERGFEEGMLFIDAGVPVACEYDYYAYSKKFFGRDAFLRFANACAAPSGIVEVFECSADGLHSALSENHAALYSPRDNELAKPLKRGFSFEEELTGAATQKQSILKKIGFKGM